MRSHRLSLPTPIVNVRLVPSTGISADESSIREREGIAREEGRLAAEKEFRGQIIQQRADLSRLQQGVLRSMREAVSQVVQQSETLLVDLAMELASRLVSDMPITAEQISANIKEALAQVDDGTEITLQVHPEDAELMEQFGWDKAQEGHDMRAIRIVKDARVERGGCVAHTTFGTVDNQRSTKVRQLRESLAS